ncbi:unnamed protein product [Oncorhynchus mykiss]|uniref:Uncharacterized protein n=1 Tax=Oncorhynchus mykiss TaxID=8022 RepID=A0A060YB00_ONCMY|nr:unnamed protein product [Oncorhynchus mykiss]
MRHPIGRRVSSSLMSTSPTMVQIHQDSREEGTTKPFPAQETEEIWYGSPDPQKVLQLQHREHPDQLHHHTTEALQRIVCTAQYTTGAKHPAIQDLYNRRCQREAHKIERATSHLNHRLFSLLPHVK